MEEVTSKYVVINNKIDGRSPQESDFSVWEEAISLKIHEKYSNDALIIVKNLYVSVDPYQVNRMKTHSFSHKIIPLVSAPIIPGQAIEANGIGRVMASTHNDFKAGDLVSGLLHWGEYSVIKRSNPMLQKLDPLGFPLSYFAGGVLGSSGLSAYGGFFRLSNPKKGDKVFVSAACGSVGILVGQYAKLFGCYVVGCAGTKEKVDLLKKIGFDDAFNYKEHDDISSTLQRYFPEGIDIYFDNVGGKMLEAAVDNMNLFGRITVCGVISEYTTDREKMSRPDMSAVVYKRIKIEGFMSVDFLDLHQEFFESTARYLREDKIKVVEDISYGVESISSAFIDLFRGGNVGKKVVRIAEN